ncbi:DUF3376 domain-containing protein [Pelagibius sp.]|uniref:DUF3376 domain-containing protein n=1 Tax=Pelagibius sp. TaxID=1931238 RepID=UPI0026290DC7|nr:DUF3376 domain-containing protein [Pelagibius sp.]
MSDDDEFQLGLVMAGAISAGAYTAGVMDFLIEALDGYYAARERPDWTGPRHRVSVPVLAGASAGGMTSAISAVHFMHDLAHQRPGADPVSARTNQLYNSWVREIDIKKLLGTRDVANRKALVSALDSTALWEIAKGALEAEGEKRKRPWVADPLAVYLTVANLRGVPYGFQLYGTGTSDAYGMTNHMDDMRFAVAWQAAAPAGFIPLDPNDCPGGNWPKLARAALATGAFPIGLSPQILDRDADDYYGRTEMRDPAFGEAKPDSYEFVCVDGGLMNNEPLELARRHLSGGSDERNPRDGEEARRAVIMIDPFPNRIEFDRHPSNDDRLRSILPQMFGALVDQARFKPEELMLAEKSNVFSRFMISPSRRNADGRQVEYAIASATLGGFGGFFEESFRRHDYLLGRKNCRSFLLRYLALPETNPLFRNLTAEQRERWYVRERNGERRMLPDSKGAPHPGLPIIPLTEDLAADEDIPVAERPKPEQVDMDHLREQVRARVRALGDVAIEEELRPILNGLLRFAGKLVLRWSLERKVTDRIMASVEGGLAPLRDPDRPAVRNGR